MPDVYLSHSVSYTIALIIGFSYGLKEPELRVRTKTVGQVPQTTTFVHGRFFVS